MIEVNIKARIKQNHFDIYAEDAFRDENAEIIKYLNSIDKKALVGIQREDGIYTIVGEEYIYYLTPSGTTGAISLDAFRKILKANAMSSGKKGDFEFLKINEQDEVWLKNTNTMNAMWNTIMYLDDANNIRKRKTE